MNDAPTKEELLAAGFELAQEHKSIVKYSIGNAYKIIVYFFEHPNGFRYLLKNPKELRMELPIEFTKQALFDFVKLSNGKELDFTPKEKTYSWDEVFGKMDNHQKNRIDSLLHNIRNSEIQNDPLEKKLTALVKLEYIIKAIEADCKSDDGGFLYCVSWVHWGFSCDVCHKNNISGIIRLKSMLSAEKLIKHHPELIKDALGVEC